MRPSKSAYPVSEKYRQHKNELWIIQRRKNAVLWNTRSRKNPECQTPHPDGRDMERPG
jgi:hypothetical protein